MCRNEATISYCCGCGTKKSVIFSAFYSVFTAVVCMSMMLLRFTTKVDVEIHSDVSALSYGSLAIYSIHIIVSFVLLAGANLDRRGTFFPWVAWTFVVMMYECLAVLLYFSASKHKQKGFRRWDVFCSLFYAVRTTINIYCLICVAWRYRNIRLAEDTPCTYVFPSPEHCERRPRLQKDLITIMGSAFMESSNPSIHPNTVIVLTSLPPPYETVPPPYGEAESPRLPPGCSSRVIVECDVDNNCDCKKIPNDVDLDGSAEEVTFLKEQHDVDCECNCRRGMDGNEGETRIRHGTIVWDENESGISTGNRRRAALVYRNPMVAEGSSVTKE